MNKELPIVDLYSDGSSRGNPGNGGYGTILRMHNSDYEKSFSQGYKLTTNNRMELLGVITGVEQLTQPCEINIYTDSKYVSDAFNSNWIDGWKKRNWAKVKNVDLWTRLLQVLEKHKYKFIWVKGHDGHEFNERCDKLAVSAALDNNNLLIDEGYMQN